MNMTFVVSRGVIANKKAVDGAYDDIIVYFTVNGIYANESTSTSIL